MKRFLRGLPAYSFKPRLPSNDPWARWHSWRYEHPHNSQWQNMKLLTPGLGTAAALYAVYYTADKLIGGGSAHHGDHHGDHHGGQHH